jgi:hypothetical protein
MSGEKGHTVVTCIEREQKNEAERGSQGKATNEEEERQGRNENTSEDKWQGKGQGLFESESETDRNEQSEVDCIVVFNFKADEENMC